MGIGRAAVYMSAAVAAPPTPDSYSGSFRVRAAAPLPRGPCGLGGHRVIQMIAWKEGKSSKGRQERVLSPGRR